MPRLQGWVEDGWRGRELPVATSAADALGIEVRPDGENDGEPVRAINTVLKLEVIAADGQAREIPAGLEVGEIRGRVNEDLPVSQQAAQGADPLGGDGVPNEELRLGGVKHGDAAREAGHLQGEVLKSGTRPAADCGEQGGLHGGGDEVCGHEAATLPGPCREGQP